MTTRRARRGAVGRWRWLGTLLGPAALAGALLGGGLPAAAGAQQMFQARAEMETRLFPHAPLTPGQSGRASASFAIEPEVQFGWGDHLLRVTAFARADTEDGARTHLDVREALWEWFAGDWEVRAGVGRVFWGVTESQHLVDIVNQTDLVEAVDGEEKLGQPLIGVTRLSAFGTFDFFLLPIFRERTFPGADGRLRTALPVLEERANVERQLDFAARWFHVLGPIDLGVSHFHGTAREPRFALVDGAEAPALAPVYETIDQTAVDAQATLGDWLFKLEALTRSGQGPRAWAAVGGFEYTFADLRGSGADLGVLAEYHFDSRPDAVVGQLALTPTPFDDDLFIGGRLALNDVQSSELLGGAVVDLSTGATATFVEASRRLGEDWLAELEARTFSWTHSSDPLHSVRRDDHLQLRLSWYY
ncbi:MAG: hypothetical protein ABFS34_08225 [Gemmatimonadota bacterium]